MNSEQEKTTKQWIGDAEEALNRTGDALKTAWNETKETRMATLEAAREAASRLGKAIDEGIEAARKSWDASQSQEPAEETSAAADTTPGTTEDRQQEE
jgi:urocanate hydratase